MTKNSAVFFVLLNVRCNGKPFLRGMMKLSRKTQKLRKIEDRSLVKIFLRPILGFVYEIVLTITEISSHGVIHLFI